MLYLIILINPQEKGYTFDSHFYRTSSQLDLFLISHSFIDIVMDCEMGDMSITDYLLELQSVSLHVDKSKGWKIENENNFDT